MRMHKDDIIDLLESLRIKEEVSDTEKTICNENKTDGKYPNTLNDPSIHGFGVPFPIYDENGETIIDRTIKGINELKLNPFEIEWMEVILYDFYITEQLLEKIDSNLIMSVAQAIEIEENNQYIYPDNIIRISSCYYGTGQGSDCFYSQSYKSIEFENINATSIAERILNKRKNAEDYKRMISKIPESILAPEEPNMPFNEYNLLDEIKILNSEIEHLRKERDDWQKRVQTEMTVKEEAFNVHNSSSCFTSRQMGILMLAVSYFTEEEPVAKTTIGQVVEKISGYKATTINQNTRGKFKDSDKEAVAQAIENKFPKLAAKVRKL